MNLMLANIELELLSIHQSRYLISEPITIVHCR